MSKAAAVAAVAESAPESIDGLVERIQRLDEADPERRRLCDLLTRQLMPTFRMISRTYEGSRGSIVRDDLVQVAAMAALRCVPTYDTAKRRSQTFRDWAMSHARRACMDHIRLHSADVRPSDGAQRGRVKRITAVVDIVVVSRDESGHSGDAHEESDPDGWLDESESRAADGEVDDTLSVEERLSKLEERYAIRRAVHRLTWRDRELVCRVFGIDRPAVSLREIARQMDESRSRLASQLEAAMHQLRSALEND